MSRLPLLLPCLLLPCCAATAQDLSRIPAAELPEATRLFGIYRTSTVPAEREQAAASLVKMSVPVLKALIPLLERDWQLALTTWRDDTTRTAADIARSRAADPAWAREVASLRKTMADLRAKGGSLTKEDLTGTGDASLKRLRQLHTITTADLTTARPALGPAGEMARALTRARAALKKKILLRDDREYTEGDLAREESAAIAAAFRKDPQAAATLALNAQTAAKGLVPADEAAGIADLNEMRMLLGLAPVLMDPKLHEAARSHSKDMVEHNFFAHDSPLPGRKTPWERAKAAGTSASAENIFAGSRDPAGANRGWFHSPGHHVNMFGRHRRAGMGRHEGHWTQLFGG